MASDTVTRATLRQRLMEATGFFFTSTTTGAGDADSVIDTAIDKFAATDLDEKWVLMTSGSAAGEEQRISSVASGDLTLTDSLSAASGSGSTYEIMPFRPTDVHRAIEHALRTVATQFYIPKRDETLIVDNLISNFDFAAFAGGAFTGWSSIGTPTLSQTTQNGATFARITASGATEGIEQDVLTSLGQFGALESKTMQAYGFVRCGTASSARLRITFDGSTYTNSVWHSGNNLWELIGPFSAPIPSGATEATLSCEVADGVTADFDLCPAWVGRIRRYTVPSAIVSLRQVRQQAHLSDPGGDFDMVGVPQSGHFLRLIGLGRLTVPTTDAGTTELDDEQAEVVIARAAARLYQQQAMIDTSYSEHHIRNMQMWEQRYVELVERGTLHSPKMSADPPRYWHLEEDSSGRYLMLEQVRV